MRGQRKLTDTPEGRAVPNDTATAADTIAALSAGLPSVAETMATRTGNTTTPAPRTGGYVLKRNPAMHQAEYVFDPNVTIESVPLRINPEDFSMLCALARKAGVPIANLQRINPAAVRAARVQARDAAEFADRYAGYKALVESVRS